MKINLSKSAKRALSLALAFTVLIGSLFTANIGINVNASTDAVNPVQIWDGSTYTKPTTTADDGAYLITTAAQLAWACRNSGWDTENAYTFRVADGIKAFVMQNYTADQATEFMTLSSADAVKEWFENEITAGNTPSAWANTTFYDSLDGNGATIYGLYMSGGSGLFSALNGSTTAGGVTVKNLAIKNSYMADSASGSNMAILARTGVWATTGTTIPAIINIQNCVVEDNYLNKGDSSGTAGALIAHAAYSYVKISNCLVADNTILKGTSPASNFVGWIDQTFTANSTTYAPPSGSSITNCIGIGSMPKINSTANVSVSQNNYYDLVSNATLGITQIAAANAQGIVAKYALSGLNWATTGDTESGKWYINQEGYPTPYCPSADWTDVTKGIWNGPGINIDEISFETGDGTKAAPYIIKTADQLYKMVREGGKKDDGAPAYYKVSPDVTDLYLNPVIDGTRATLENLVSAGTAFNWTAKYSYNTEIADSNSDGLKDESQAFRGYFDGNGVTIHGLYSTNSGITTAWEAYGIGFVPSIKGDAVIKNVTFDKSYIENTDRPFAGVITASLGFDSDNIKVENSTFDGDTKEYDNRTTHAALYNVAVRNAYIKAASNANYYSKGGFIGSHGGAGSITFKNCLYDGDSSIMVDSSKVEDTSGKTAGIYMASSGSAEGVTMVNCVSIGMQPINTGATSAAKVVDCYTTDTSITATNEGDNVNVVNAYSSESNLPLLNWGMWSIKTVNDGNGNRQLPMPAVTNSEINTTGQIKDLVLAQVGGAGNFNYTGAQTQGEYGHYHKLTGSGTATDPYLIYNATDLAVAISTGGVNVSNKLYYKLTCDINLGSLPWIDTQDVENTTYGYYHYIYVPFAGELDGNGYTIYELNATGTNSGALIPQLNGGTVKNLHIRNSAAGTALFAAGTGTVKNCSVADSYVATGATGATAMASGATVSNSCYNQEIINANDVSTAEKTFTYNGVEYDAAVWYIGGMQDSKPQLINRANAMPLADVDGDGEGYEYASADLTALENRLLKKKAYANVYGDVSGNGKTNISDLVILSRAIADNYKDVKDGFWRNLALGNFKIYYGENDNYDAARKLELYLEGMSQGIDIKKVVSAENVVSGASSDSSAVYRHANDEQGAPDGQLEIIVGNIANYNAYKTNTVATDANTYAITYDKENAVLWLQGENFTAVEQAVLDFINNNDFTNKTLYTAAKTTLLPDKMPIDLDGDGEYDYYYAWGDEFDNGLVEDNWEYSTNATEASGDERYTGKYLNLETAVNEDLEKLYVDNLDGTLSMKRGVYDTTVNRYIWDNGYGYVSLTESRVGRTNAFDQTIEEDDIYVSGAKLISEQSLLVKQGYFEFRASLPSDGHAFPSWWMMGAPSAYYNNALTHSLFGKVYKLNTIENGSQNPYDGKSNYFYGNDPSTYKYQLPNSYFELDLIELMQDASFHPNPKDVNDKTYNYALPFNMHKYYDTGLVTVDDVEKYYPIDWSTGTVMSDYTDGLEKGDIDLTSSNDWILSLGGRDHGMVHKFGDNNSYLSYVEENQTKLIAMRRYGFEWKVTNDDFEYTLYVYDVNGDGNDEDVSSYTINRSSVESKYNESGDSTDPISDLEVANQYMFFLIDNKFYTANPDYVSGGNFSDLLTKDNTNEKTCLDIDYMRVYQADGRRDIVTQETEHFNNGNHFGY